MSRPSPSADDPHYLLYWMRRTEAVYPPTDPPSYSPSWEGLLTHHYNRPSRVSSSSRPMDDVTIPSSGPVGEAITLQQWMKLNSATHEEGEEQ